MGTGGLNASPLREQYTLLTAVGLTIVARLVHPMLCGMHLAKVP